MAELVIDDIGAVRRLRINRPEVRNALSRSLRQRLVESLIAADSDPTVSVVIIAGAGDSAFCAGIDVKELDAEADSTWRGPYAEAGRSVWQVLAEFGKPTIAAVNGLAVGGGFELLLACDLVVAREGILVGLPEAKLGLAASFASAQLPRRVPHGVACELLFTAELRPIDDLLPWGLVQRVVLDGVDDAAVALATAISANAPISLRRMKATITKGMDLPLMSAVTLNSGPDPYVSEDRIEGVRAFTEKRQPRWSGR